MERHDIEQIIEISQMGVHDRSILLDKVLAAFPTAVLQVWAQSHGNDKQLSALGGKYGVHGYNTETHKKVINLIDRGMFIDAIKHVRAVTGAGLKESKDLCDRIRDGG